MKLLKLVLGLILSLNFATALDIRVGSENTYKPFAYLDENGVSVGFDNEVVRAVAAYIKDANLKFVPVNWNAIFSGLESGKFDIVANQIAKSKEREEKYIFSKKPYFYGVSAVIFGKENMKDFDDLKGKKIGVTVGSNHAKNLENYQKTHPEISFEIVYYKTSPSLVADLANERVAAIINDPISTIDLAKAQNIKVYPSQIVLEKTPVFFIFRKDSQKLADIFDEALEKALKDGKIAEISMKYFGSDFSR